MTLIQTFHGTASNGTPLTAVYAEQPAAAAAFALVFPGSAERCTSLSHPKRQPFSGNR